MSNLLKASLAAAIITLALPLDSFAQQAGTANAPGSGPSASGGGHQPIIINRSPNQRYTKPYLPNTCQCKEKAGKMICRERIIVDNSYMYKRCQRS